MSSNSSSSSNSCSRSSTRSRSCSRSNSRCADVSMGSNLSANLSEIPDVDNTNMSFTDDTHNISIFDTYSENQQ